MKTLIAFLLLLVFCGSSFAQNDAELLILKTLLGVPPNTKVISSGSKALPTEAPLKVYIDVSGDSPERDSKVQENLKQSLNELAAGSEKNPPAFELVSDAAQANVALVYFTDFPSKLDDGANAGEVGGTNTRPGQTDSSMLISNTMTMQLVISTYIVAKEPAGLRILYRRQDYVMNRTSVVMAQRSISTVVAKLKDEIGKEMDKRIARGVFYRNAKFPHEKLRDEFATLLKAQTTLPTVSAP
jgi:hypothetical protein